MRTSLRVYYDCSNCPAWCCSYPNIAVAPTDLLRLAKHFGISAKEAERKFTKHSPDMERPVLRHRKDRFFGSACRFLDQKARRCTIYLARPLACRVYPGTGRCGYYDFLMAERNRQRDDSAVVTTDHRLED
jgi:Fe-S-cluster containining protein